MIGASLMMILNNRIKEYEKTDAAKKDRIKLSAKSLSRILDELNTIMITMYKDGYFFDEICGKYRALLNAVEIPIPEAKHKYIVDKNEVAADDEIIDEYETESDDLENIDGEQL